VNGTKYEVSQYEAFSIFLSHSSWVLISASRHCFKIPLARVPSLTYENMHGSPKHSVIKYIRLRWAVPIASMEVGRSSYKISTGKLLDGSTILE
jgi:hypothetical protein